VVGAIDHFRGEHEYLSNFYLRPVVYEGVAYPSTEHAFQAAKTRDAERRWAIATLPTCREAKRAGRAVRLRPEWEQIKYRAMADVLIDKFTRWSDLREKLLTTDNAELIEGNRWHDNVWGDCRCPRCRGTPGKNALGQILMQVRQGLMDGTYRPIPLPTRVCLKREAYDVFCGRVDWCPAGWTGPGADGRWGNYRGSVGAFRRWFEREVDVNRDYRVALEVLRGRRLGCFCDPGKPCHADTYVEWFESGAGVEAAAVNEGDVLARMAARLGGGV